MNWQDELIEDCREDDGTLHPQTDHVLSGAHWMLRRLRTDEAVERLALHLIKDEGIDVSDGWPTNEYFGGGPAGDRDMEFKWAWMNSTRAVINALLGED